LAFAIGMTVGTGVKSALNASAFAASAGSFLLARLPIYRFTVDNLTARNRHKKLGSNKK